MPSATLSLALPWLFQSRHILCRSRPFSAPPLPCVSDLFQASARVFTSPLRLGESRRHSAPVALLWSAIPYLCNANPLHLRSLHRSAVPEHFTAISFRTMLMPIAACPNRNKSCPGLSSPLTPSRHSSLHCRNSSCPCQAHPLRFCCVQCLCQSDLNPASLMRI